jgi:uncharacterized protein (DUF1499 family)
MIWLCLAVIVLVVLQAAVRLAPVEAKRWHVDPFEVDDPKDGGVLIVHETTLSEADAMARLTAIASAEPRTQRIGGTEANTWQTYQSRTLFWGFPDYTTLKTRTSKGKTQIAIFARLRFGRKDFGVNGRRVEAWIKAADL